MNISKTKIKNILNSIFNNNNQNIIVDFKSMWKCPSTNRAEQIASYTYRVHSVSLEKVDNKYSVINLVFNSLNDKLSIFRLMNSLVWTISIYNTFLNTNMHEYIHSCISLYSNNNSVVCVNPVDYEIVSDSEKRGYTTVRIFILTDNILFNNHTKSSYIHNVAKKADKNYRYDKHVMSNKSESEMDKLLMIKRNEELINKISSEQLSGSDVQLTVIKSMVGLTEKNEPKSALALQVVNRKKDNNSETGYTDEILSEIEIFSPAINYKRKEMPENIKRTYKRAGFDPQSNNYYCNIPLIFKNRYDPALKKVESLLELYKIKRNAVINERAASGITDTPDIYINLIITPMELGGTIAVSANRMINAVPSLRETDNEPCIINLQFFYENIDIHQLNNIDIDAIKERVDKEIEIENERYKKMIQRMKEEEEYQIERNERLEELRRGRLND